MRTFASVAIAYLLAAVLLRQAVLVFARAGERAGFGADLAPSVGIVGVGLAGYGAFFVYLLSAKLGLACSVLVCIGLIVSMIRHQRRGGGAAGENLPFVLALLFGLVYLSSAYLFVPGKIDGLPNVLFFESVRPGDNFIPMTFADAIYKHAASGTNETLWYYSDRPPLQTGFALFFTPLRAIFGNSDAYQAIGTLLQTSIVPALWLLGRALRLRRSEILLSVLTISGSGFVFYNSIYVWPKLLTATFFLIALAPIGRALLENRRLTVPETLVVAAASVLAMLSHGAIAFSLLALSIMLAVTVAKFFSARTFAYAAMAAAILYAPWFGYTHFINPNTDRLLKMHLTDGDSTSPEPFLAMLVRSYRDITFERWADNRLENVKMLLGSDSIGRVAFEISAGLIDPQRQHQPVSSEVTFDLDATKLSYDLKSLVTLVRVDQREHMLWSFGLLNIAWPALLLFIWPAWRARAPDKGILGLMVLNVLTLLVWITLEFNGGWAVNTHASYAMIIIGMLTAVLVLFRLSPVLACALCFANIALSAVTWILFLPGPAVAPPQGVNWLALVAAVLSGGSIVWAARNPLAQDQVAMRPDA